MNQSSDFLVLTLPITGIRERQNGVRYCFSTVLYIKCTTFTKCSNFILAKLCPRSGFAVAQFAKVVFPICFSSDAHYKMKSGLTLQLKISIDRSSAVICTQNMSFNSPVLPNSLSFQTLIGAVKYKDVAFAGI